MIQLVPHMKILVAVAPVDFRRGIDGLAAVCRRELAADPHSGALFLFRNRSGTAIKALIYDGLGFWLCHRRFSRGKLQWWPNIGDPMPTAHQVSVLLAQGDPRAAGFTPEWRPIATEARRLDPFGSSPARPAARPANTTTR